MDFIFTCPNHNRSFTSGEFTLMENKGVKTDESGNKSLDAKVALLRPCPFCGERHVYEASHLACPFQGANGVE